jgi:hypothetical protein
LARTGSVGNQQAATYSGVLQHPENCNRLEAFKIKSPGLSGL